MFGLLNDDILYIYFIVFSDCRMCAVSFANDTQFGSTTNMIRYNYHFTLDIMNHANEFLLYSIHVTIHWYHPIYDYVTVFKLAIFPV